MVNACGSGCSRYASDYPCSYVLNDAEYEVWYWRDVEGDNEENNKMIGRAIGLQMCEFNARAFAAAVNEEFNYRAYICVLMKDGNRMEKHRLLSGYPA
jgi:hypothetical protein